MKSFFKDISLQGLKLYVTALVALLAAYTYMQLNGIRLWQESGTEHEGNNHTHYNHK